MDWSVSNLACARGQRVVLSDVSFEVKAGEARVLRGPNGTGKTTLLRCLAGLAPPLRGTHTLDPEAVAYAAHADGLKAQMTVSENLTFWSRIFQGAPVGQAMDAMDLSALSARKAGQLSAGQKRRLSLARLLVTGRPVWLLDEPTVSLDAAHVSLFADMVKGHLAHGGSALIATHIDLGLPKAREIDVTPFVAKPEVAQGAFAEAVE